ncbi:hypothetical protein H0H93_005941, partial [Arthromyces matolae]
PVSVVEESASSSKSPLTEEVTVEPVEEIPAADVTNSEEVEVSHEAEEATSLKFEQSSHAESEPTLAVEEVPVENAHPIVEPASTSEQSE